MSQNIKEEISITCSTPYQLFVILDLVLNDKNEDVVYDLYLSEAFDDSYVKRIKALGCFANIYRFLNVCNPPTLSKVKDAIINILKKEYKIQKYTIESIDWKSKNYSVIMMSTYSSYKVLLAEYYKNARIYFFEDGIGSYRFTEWKPKGTRIGNIIRKILRQSRESMSFDRMYLFYPELSYLKDKAKLKKLPDLKLLDNMNWEKIHSVFNYTNRIEKYFKNKIVYLTQPLYRGEYILGDAPETLEKVKEIFENVEKILSNYQSNCIIRNHPRDTINHQISVDKDTDNELWELLCKEGISDGHTLIGLFSTSQITPKLLYDKEPYIIFLLNLIDQDTKNKMNLDTAQALITDIQKVYRDPEKVLSPSSYEELKKQLDNIYS